MNDKRTNLLQGLSFVLVTIIILLGFLLIRQRLILPTTKYYKVTNYYSGTLKNKSNLNNYEMEIINAETLMNRMFYDFKTKIKHSPKEAYKLVNKSKSSLFTNYDTFEKLLPQLTNSKIVKYKTIGKTIKIIDQNKYRYIFTYNNPISYRVNIEKNE